MAESRAQGPDAFPKRLFVVGDPKAEDFSERLGAFLNEMAADFNKHNKMMRDKKKRKKS